MEEVALSMRAMLSDEDASRRDGAAKTFFVTMIHT